MVFLKEDETLVEGGDVTVTDTSEGVLINEMERQAVKEKTARRGHFGQESEEERDKRGLTGREGRGIYILSRDKSH